MGSVNEVTLVGNLTRNPELRHTSNKKPVYPNDEIKDGVKLERTGHE